MLKKLIVKQYYLFVAIAVVCLILAIATQVRAQNAAPDNENEPVRPIHARPVPAQVNEQQEPRASQGNMRTQERAERGQTQNRQQHLRYEGTETERARNAQREGVAPQAHRAGALGRQLHERLEAMIERFDNMYARTENRIITLANDGHDVGRASAALLNARDAIEEARTQKEEVRAAMQALTEEEAPAREMRGQIRTALEQLRASLRDARTFLVEATRAVRAGTEEGARDQEL